MYDWSYTCRFGRFVGVFQYSMTPLHIRWALSIDVEVDWSYPLVISWCVVFGGIVGKVLNAFFPVNFELLLRNAVSNPIKTHIDCFRLSLFHGATDDATCCAVVRGEWGCRLGVT